MERGWSIERRGVGQEPEAGAGLGRRLRVLGQREVSGGRGWEAAGRLQWNRKGFLSLWRGPAARSPCGAPLKEPTWGLGSPRPRVARLTEALGVGTLPDQSEFSGRPGGGPALPSGGLLSPKSAPAVACGNTRLWNSSDFPALTPAVRESHFSRANMSRRRLPSSLGDPWVHPTCHTLRKNPRAQHLSPSVMINFM